MDEIQLLDIPDAAQRLKLSPYTVADPRWRQRVGLPIVKVGRLVRFHPRALEEWCQRRTQGGQSA